MNKIASVITATLLIASGTALASQELATAKNCMACHSVDAKVVGPAYKDVAAKYGKDKAAATKLADSIIKGSTGKWGTVPMPPNAVTPVEAATLAKWVLTLKK